MTAVNVTDPLIQPPPHLLTTVVDPTTKEPGYAFPLQTDAWLKMQTVVNRALAFPLSKDDFSNLYGTFTDEGTVQSALEILGQINTTAKNYGDPKTLISDLAAFQQVDTPPDSIYGHAVWLAAQTQLAAQQIGSLLEQGLTDIGSEPPGQRVQDLTDLLTGDGGINSYATKLRDYISHIDPDTKKDSGFLGAVGDFYDELNAELTGPTNSLQWYLNQSKNVLADAKSAVSGDEQQISQLNDSIKQLNDEYIGFTVAACASPAMILVPFFGELLVIADATTFGVLAGTVKKQLDDANDALHSAEEDDQKKAALVTVLGSFNDAAGDVGDDGRAFLNAIGQLSSGWTEFIGQITTRLQALTAEDVQNWSSFLDRVGFRTAIEGWNLISAKAEQFFQAGFVTFAPADKSSWLAEGTGAAR